MTGASVPGGLLAAAVVLIAGGVLFLLAVRRARQRGSAEATGDVPRALTVLVLVVGLGLGMQAMVAPSATAAAPVLDYDEGCTLITVDGIDMPPATDLLPGDTTTVLTAEVTNLFEETIEVSAVAILPESADETAPFALSTLVGHHAQPLLLAPGQVTTVSVALTFPTGAGNEVQEAGAPLVLTITGAQV
ncbi:hypothetical protein [Bogoriella caseilytica]|uniref:hypothetical protein n=1 Tax=Bogoriella caseilytica TaxID=56055 RepID=UPI000F487CC3|nr:hypothetical protein [Bogoriella caseilytica]